MEESAQTIPKMSCPNVQEILARVSEIRKKHELVAEMTGEKFNVFQILRLHASETRTHSALIRELLDPRGSHGLKDVFLKAFVQKVAETITPSELVTADGESLLGACVSAEKFVGFKSEDCSRGGRIDLVIDPRNGGRKILVENKIYASDQECQLVRYHNYDPNALLLYLTLQGGEASKFSTCNQLSCHDLVHGKDYFAISYKSVILPWLEVCRREAAGHPLVRETIIQYINLIKDLTHQNRSNQMSDDIKNAVLKSKESYLAYRAIIGAQDAVSKEFHEQIKAQLIEVANGFEDWGLALDSYNENVEFYFSSTKLASANLAIGFRSEDGIWFFGLSTDPEKAPSPLELPNIWPDPLGMSEEGTRWWPVWWPWREYESQWDAEMLASIRFDPSDEDQASENSRYTRFQNDVAGKIRHLLEGLSLMAGNCLVGKT